MNTLILSKKLLPVFIGFIFIAGPTHEATEVPVENLEFIEEVVIQPNRSETVFKRKVISNWKFKQYDLSESSDLHFSNSGYAISKSLPLYRLYCSSLTYD